MRLPATELLKDPFLATVNSKDLICDSLRVPINLPVLVNPPQPEYHAMDIDSNCKKLSVDSGVKSINGSSNSSTLEFQSFTKNNEFRLRGQRIDDDNTISLTLRITDPCGHVRNIHFSFYLDSDTATAIAQEMVEQLDLSKEDVAVIRELIDNLINQLASSLKSFFENHSYEKNGSFGVDSGSADTLVNHDDCYKALNEYGFNSEYGVYDHGGHNEKSYEASSSESVMINEPAKNSASSFDLSCSVMSKNLDLSNICSLSLADKGQYDDLKLELEAIDSQYHQQFIELLRMREEAIENARNRMMTCMQFLQVVRRQHLLSAWRAVAPIVIAKFNRLEHVVGVANEELKQAHALTAAALERERVAKRKFERAKAACMISKEKATKLTISLVVLGPCF
ncbi:serine/threonine-protein kinase wnk8 [Quercus suber]|uniref:non-specific serine/threonine protein kinase n=1 Tax=Quercus suber TaxID=58331 RepID=A0AAW0L7P0_QUESU